MFRLKRELTSPPSELLTIKEAAAVLRVGTAAVYRLVHSGKLRAFRIRRDYRITRASLEELIRELELEAREYMKRPKMTR